jgi:hypothetical protein
MPYSAVPTTFFGAGYSVGTNTIIMNTADAGSNKTLAQLTDVEAHATTGDFRKIVFAIMEMLAVKWEATAVADRPTKLSITKSSSLNSQTGAITNAYTVVCYNELGAQEVAAEPV